MRKRTINSGSEAVSRSGDEWLDLERLARVEITSESAEHPIESALILDRGPGWRAAQPGKQTIRLIFDQPLSLGRILLRFDEKGTEAHAGIRAALVTARPAVAPRDRASAVYLQSARH